MLTNGIDIGKLLFSENLHRYKTCWSVTTHHNVPTFQTQKHGHISILTKTRSNLKQAETTQKLPETT